MKHPVFPLLGWSCHLCKRSFGFFFRRCPYCPESAAQVALNKLDWETRIDPARDPTPAPAGRRGHRE